MTINKFQGKTKEEAIQKAKDEFGENAVILNVKEVKPKGMFKTFKSSTYEVTAALEEREETSSQAKVLEAAKKAHENINVAVDEAIAIPKPVRTPSFESMVQEHENKTRDDKNIEERLDNLSNILEKKLGKNPKDEKDDALQPLSEVKPKQSKGSEELKFARILYNTLLNNDVNEKYINQVMDEVEKFLKPGNSVDVILSNVYQKLVLRFGQTSTIDLNGQKPKVLFFIGPTGVGKTTTIAKIASKYKGEMDKRVAFITADTYRIAATEQLRVYANILEAPMEIVYSVEELDSAIAKFEDYDLIFVDTAGFSHKNETQRADIKKLINGINPEYEKEVYLVLSATTKYKDLTEIVDIYREISDFKLIFTKLDETSTYGNIFNIRMYTGASLSYITNGQSVPDDIEVFDTQKIVKQLLGGK